MTPQPWPHLCANCRAWTWPRRTTPGNLPLELLLWLLCLLPGLAYTIWRLTATGRRCHHCHSPHLIPPGTPQHTHALQIAQHNHHDPRTLAGPRPNTILPIAIAATAAATPIALIALLIIAHRLNIY